MRCRCIFSNIFHRDRLAVENLECIIEPTALIAHFIFPFTVFLHYHFVTYIISLYVLGGFKSYVYRCSILLCLLENKSYVCEHCLFGAELVFILIWKPYAV